MARQVIRPATVHPVRAYSHGIRNGNIIKGILCFLGTNKVHCLL